MGYLQGAALAQASGFSLEAYASITNERLPTYVERIQSFGDALVEHNYDVTVANLDAWTSGCVKTEARSRELGVDETVLSAFTQVLQKALDTGYGGKEILAVLEVLLPHETQI